MGAGQAVGSGCSASDADQRFTVLFSTYHQAIRSYFAFRTHDSELADELASATFEFAWRRIDEMPAEPATRGWLYMVSKRILSNYWRGSTRQRKLISKISASVPLWEGDPTSGTDDDVALCALNSLRPREREALRLVYWDDLGHAEAAKVLGCTLNAFDILLHRARRHMLAMLESPTFGSGHGGANL